MSKTVQQQKIEKYFNLLVKEFINDSAHKDITITFVDSLGEVKTDTGKVVTMGLTEKSSNSKTTGLQDGRGNRKPGSERTTGTHKYTIRFLNNYETDDAWRAAVCHEFTHLYLYSTIDEHTHDDNFYSHQETFEDGLDQNQGGEPRKDKSGDKLQHQDGNTKYKPKFEEINNQEGNDTNQPSNRPWGQDPIILSVGLGVGIVLSLGLVYILLSKKKKNKYGTIA